MNAKHLNPFRVLNSVFFGISMAVLAGAYVVLGVLRPSLGGWFDRTNAMYFNAWPLKLLFTLIAMSLMMVTWRRVPLARAWYGLWCINAGIIILIGGLSLHFQRSVKGWVRIYLDPTVGPMTVDRFYDDDQRSLFIRLGQEAPVEIPLPTLPRFGEYDQSHAKQLSDRGLVGIELVSTDAAGTINLAELIGCTGQRLKVDVIEFYSNAKLSTDFVSDPSSQVTGVKVTTSSGVRWMVGSDARYRVDEDFSGMEVQHLDVDDTTAAGVIEAAQKLISPEAGVKTDSGPHDPFQLLPLRKKVRHTFLTPPSGNELIDIVAEAAPVGIKVQRLPNGVEDLASEAKIHIERIDHVRLVDNVVAEPRLEPFENKSQSRQVATLKVSMGSWSTILNLPHAEDAADHLSQDHWRGGYVKPPGAIAQLQLQLGNTTRPLPTSLSLLESKDPCTVDSIFAFTLNDSATVAATLETAKLNEPIYFNGGKWVFTPTAYDPNQKWVQMKVESRPALVLIIAGGSMVCFGAVYSVFALLVRRRNRAVV